MEKNGNQSVCVCVALRSEANNGWRQLDVLNTLYVLCHTACWCLSIHFPTSFQLLTLEKCAAAAADGGGGERPSRKSMRRNKKQKRDPSLHHVWNPPSAVYSLIQAQVRCRNDDDWNKRGTLQQRNSSSKLLYLWLLFCVFIFPFALTSTWHWCDAINSWEEKSQFAKRLTAWSTPIPSPFNVRYYPSTVITSQFERRDCFSQAFVFSPFDWLWDELQTSEREKTNKSDWMHLITMHIVIGPANRDWKPMCKSQYISSSSSSSTCKWLVDCFLRFARNQFGIEAQCAVISDFERDHLSR